MIDRYGLPRPDRDEWYGRPALWTRALEHGCQTDDLARAYNVSRDAITLAVRRYMRNGKPKQGEGL